ncbi:hypothetical protein PS639_00851 [Pseudomonas fluorescens]|nr:hypothetical protein PS639_00851 [Pseudomonas fluorescens]
MPAKTSSRAPSPASRIAVSLAPTKAMALFRTPSPASLAPTKAMALFRTPLPASLAPTKSEGVLLDAFAGKPGSYEKRRCSFGRLRRQAWLLRKRWRSFGRLRRQAWLLHERDALHHLQVVTGQACIFQRRAEVAQLAHAKVLQNLCAGTHFRIDVRLRATELSWRLR